MHPKNTSPSASEDEPGPPECVCPWSQFHYDLSWARLTLITLWHLILRIWICLLFIILLLISNFLSGLWHLTLNLLFPQVWERVVLCLRVKAQESSCWDWFPSFATQHRVTLGKSNELSKAPVFLSVKWEWLMGIVRVSFGNPCGVLRGPYRLKVITCLFISLRASYAPGAALLLGLQWWTKRT